MTGLAYDPTTGIFTRNGCVAGTVNGQGYVQIKLEGRAYLAQRLAWFAVTGEWPENDVDHRNRNKQDNRFVNLRKATGAQNLRNRGKQKNNTSGFKGVSWSAGRGAWLAMIHDGTKNKYLGYFATRENAAKAYDAAALEYHGEFAKLNFGGTDMKTEDFIHMPIPASMFTAVCALLGGTAAIAHVASTRTDPTMPEVAAKQAANTPSIDKGSSDVSGAVATSETVASDPNDIDADGHPWSADLHASTRTKTKDGLWRMKVGVSRPAPVAGFPKDGAGVTGTASSGAASPASDTAASTGAGPANSAVEEDDEFAMFRAASEKSNATDAAAAASAPARKWTDADLGALCNQAAVKLGDPSPVKEIIADYIPEGQVAHSRNIPDADREAFAQAVEKTAGITFNG
jgi:hypothetical protein